jgi:hypothetical protein
MLTIAIVALFGILLQTKEASSLVTSGLPNKINIPNNVAYANYWENLLLEEHR